jgi:hypothetical protein
VECAYAQQPPDSVASDVLGNTAMGYNAMLNNAGGDYNTAAGYDSMTFNTIGSMNVAFGYGTLNANVSGNRNAAVGDDALHLLGVVNAIVKHKVSGHTFLPIESSRANRTRTGVGLTHQILPGVAFHSA